VYAELAAAHDSVVCLLVGPDQLAAMPVAAARVPGVPIVIDHLGRPDLADDADAAVARLVALASSANVYVKVSALPVVAAGWSTAFLAEAIRAVVGAFGADRVMWGSEHPFAEALAPQRALAAALEDSERDLVLGESAWRLFFTRAS
jgi:predicted TIM-barrel fold metal-dependent hydrolase